MQSKPQMPMAFMSMVEVTRVNGIFIDVKCWDHNDHILRSVFTGSEIHPPPEEGDIYLMGLRLEQNMWRVYFCSDVYETVEVDMEADDGKLEY